MMMAGKQKAGDGSLQVQAGIINIGVDEKRVCEIVDEKLRIALQYFSEEANQTALRRNKYFSNNLVERMTAEGALSVFADPSFQLLLIEAQKRAASTERESDYALLSELMLHRFKKGSNRNVKASISRAVEIVDQISDEALLGLTVLHATAFMPVSGQITQGLDALDSLFGRLIYSDLPTDNDWIDHLEILDTIRVFSFGNMEQLEDHWMSNLEGYNVGGLGKNSEEYKDALIKLRAVGINEDSIFIEHELNAENVRLKVVNKDQIKDLSVTSIISTKDGETLYHREKVSDEQKKALEEVYDITNKTKIDKRIFIDELEKRSNLKRLKEWLNGIHQALQITGVGKVLAHSNAQRIDKTLPPLD